LTLLATVARRRVIERMRYPVELIMQVAVFYVLFLFLFQGARTFGGAAVSSGDTLSAIVVGYIVFMFTSQSFNTLAGQVQQESTTGTLEQLALSRYGLLRVLVLDFAVQAVLDLALVAIVLLPIMATTGRWLHFELGSVSVVLVLLVTGMLGLGIVLGGLALVLKRMGALQGFAFFLILGLIAAPIDRYPLLKAFPVGHGNFLLRQALVKNVSAFSQPGELLVLLVVSAAYFVIGILVFRVMEGIAKDRALLGQY
jgi:ABC-2 type transport system permease protein